MKKIGKIKLPIESTTRVVMGGVAGDTRSAKPSQITIDKRAFAPATTYTASASCFLQTPGSPKCPCPVGFPLPSGNGRFLWNKISPQTKSYSFRSLRPAGRTLVSRAASGGDLRHI